MKFSFGHISRSKLLCVCWIHHKSMVSSVFYSQMQRLSIAIDSKVLLIVRPFSTTLSGMLVYAALLFWWHHYCSYMYKFGKLWHILETANWIWVLYHTTNLNLISLQKLQHVHFMPTKCSCNAWSHVFTSHLIWTSLRKALTRFLSLTHTHSTRILVYFVFWNCLELFFLSLNLNFF
jgi:hypothetical protein